MRACHLKKKIIYFFLSDLDALSFSCLIALSKTSSTVLHRIGENRNPVLFLI